MSAAVGVPESFVARKAAGQTVKKVRFASNSTEAFFLYFDDQPTKTLTMDLFENV